MNARRFSLLAFGLLALLLELVLFVSVRAAIAQDQSTVAPASLAGDQSQQRDTLPSPVLDVPLGDVMMNEGYPNLLGSGGAERAPAARPRLQHLHRHGYACEYESTPSRVHYGDIDTLPDIDKLSDDPLLWRRLYRVANGYSVSYLYSVPNLYPLSLPVVPHRNPYAFQYSELYAHAHADRNRN